MNNYTYEKKLTIYTMLNDFIFLSKRFYDNTKDSLYHIKNLLDKKESVHYIKNH